MGDTFLFNGDYGDLMFDIIKKITEQKEDFDQIKEEILSVADEEIADLQKMISWWIIVKRMLNIKKPDYYDILDQIENKIRKIELEADNQ